VSQQDFNSCRVSHFLSSLCKCLGVSNLHLSNSQLVFMHLVQHLLHVSVPVSVQRGGRLVRLLFLPMPPNRDLEIGPELGVCEAGE